MCKSGDWCSKKRKDALKSFLGRGYSTLGYNATLLLHGGEGLTRQQVKRKELENALKGQMAGICALQPLLRLKNHSSVFRNTYMLNRKGVDTHLFVAELFACCQLTSKLLDAPPLY